MSGTRSRWLAGCLALAALPLGAADPEARFLCFAPSPYTHRHDAFRAGMGIYLSLQKLIADRKLPLRATFHDGMPALEHAEKGKALLRGAQVLVIGGSTWAQGSSYYLRRFFELTNLEPLTGVSASAWMTAGGSHTGGETAVQDTMRTLMGMGAEVFSLGQKLMVFSTDERTSPPEGRFTPLDAWYMDQFARAIAVAALGRSEPEKVRAAAGALGYTPFYWNQLPRDERALEKQYRPLLDRINAAADPQSGAYRELRALVSP